MRGIVTNGFADANITSNRINQIVILVNQHRYTMRINIQRFKSSNESDFDTRVFIRTLSGNLTDGRRNRIDKIARLYTESHSAPYGVSPIYGYAYRCGCEHDCCGCIIHDFMEVENYSDKVIVKIIKTYNY